MKENQLPNTFLNQSRDSLWMVNLDFELIYANKTYLSIMQTITGKEQKLYDSVFHEDLSKEDEEKWKTYYKKAFKGEYFEVEDHYYNSELKETQYGQTTFEPLKNNDNKIFAVACSWKNVTNIIKHRNEENQLMDASLDVFCTFNVDGEFVYVSKASEKNWGYKPEELIGKKYIEMTLEEDVSKTEEIANAIESGYNTKTFQNRFKTKDGGIAYNLWSSRWDDAAQLFYAVARDNQEQVKQEEKIKQSEERFKALVQEGLDLFAIIDRKGNYTYMSPSSISIIGIPPEDFVGKNAFEFLHPDDIDDALDSLKKILTQDKVFMKHYRAKNHKNEWRWVETILTNMLHNPAVKGIVINSRDITNEVEEKQHLKLLESVITNTNDAVLITEAEPFDEPGPKIIYVNEAFTKMTGYTAEEVIGKTPRILQGPKSDKKELAKLSKAIRNWEPYEVTTINYKKNGEEFCINFAVTPVANEKGWYTHWIAIERDVTEKIEAQEKLIKAKELAEENERKAKEAKKLAKLGSWYYDVIKNVSYWSEETYNIWGLDPNITKIAFLDHKKLIHPKDWERFKAVINDATEKEIPYKLELELIMPDGSSKIVINLGEPVFNKKNKLIAFRGTTQDITDRKAIENELKIAKEKAEKSEHAMNQASKLAKIGYWYYDSVTQTLTWSDYIYKLYDLTPEDDIPNYEEAKGFFDSKSQEKITKAAKELDKNGTSYDLELRMINSKNEEIWVRNVVQPVYNDQNEIVGKRGIIRNITEEKSLRDLNDDVAKMVKIGSWSIDLEKNTLFWSKQVHQLHETDPKTYTPIVNECFNFFREDFHEMVQSAFDNTIKTGEGWDFEAVIVTANKKERWIRSIGNAEFNNDKCVRLFGGMQNIDNRKKYENRLISLSDNLPGIAFEYRIHPDKTESLKSISGKVEEIWGFKANEVIDNANLVWAQIKAGGQLKELDESIANSIETKSRWQYQFKYVMPKTNKIHTHLASASPSFLADGTVVFNAIIQDVTKAAKNEILLQQTNKMAKIGSWEMDLINQDGDQMYWSPSILDILEIDDKNYTPTLKDGIDFHVGESQERIKKSLQLLIEEGIEFDEEILLRTSKGNERWCRAIGKSELINDVRVKIYGSYQDIHELKTANLSLKKNIKELRDYKYSLDQSAIITFTNQKGEITSVNDNFCKISGYNENEVIGKTHRIINSNYHTKSFFSDMWKTIISGKVWRGEVKNKAKDGVYYWVDTTIVPFLNEKNKPTQYLAIRFDITDRKQAEDEKTRFQETLENSLNEIYMFDSETFKFSYANKGAKLNLGYTKEELKKLTPLDLKPEHTLSSFNKLVAPLKDSKKDKVVFFTNHKRKNGSLYPVEVHLKLVEEYDYKNFIAIVLDITERKKAEETLILTSERLRLATTSAELGIWDWDVANDNLTWDDRMYEMYGVKEEDFEGALVAWKNGVHPDDLEKATKDLEDALKGKRDFNCVFRVVWPDKSVHYIEGSAIVSRDEKGNAIRIIGANIDVTDIKNAEQEILEAKEKVEASEAKFKSYTEKSPVAIYTTNLQGDCTYVNETWLKIAGMKGDEVLGNGWKKAVHPDDLHFVKMNWEKSIKSLGKFKSEYRFVNQINKKVTWVEGSAKELFNDKNELIGYLGTNVDITARKKALKEIEASEAKFKSYTEKSPIIVSTSNLKGETNYLNQAWEELTGLSVKESLGQGWLKVLHPDDLDFVINNWYKSVESRGKFKFEYRYIHQKDNRIVWVQASAKELRNEKDEHIGYIGTIIDITERKEAEEQYRLLADNTNDIIALQETDFSLKYISPAVKNLLGYAPKELIDKDFFNLIHEDDFFSAKREINKKLLQSEDVKPITFRVRHKKGNIVWLETLISPIKKGEKIISILSSSRDITEAIEAQNEIKDYQFSLQKLTKEISLIEENQKKEIASNIHDHLSQSLVISKMRITDLEKKEELTNFTEDLGFIKNHISNALENSRKITYNLSPPVLYQLGLIEALDWFAEEIKSQYKIDFQFNYNVDRLHLTEFQSISLFRCIQEAVTNTIKYAEASLITLTLEKAPKELTIVLTDDGKGFDTKKLNNIVSSESGFGLFAVKERIRSINGEFNITSEINVGTKIKIFVSLK